MLGKRPVRTYFRCLSSLGYVVNATAFGFSHDYIERPELGALPTDGFLHICWALIGRQRSVCSRAEAL